MEVGCEETAGTKSKGTDRKTTDTGARPAVSLRSKPYHPAPTAVRASFSSEKVAAISFMTCATSSSACSTERRRCVKSMAARIITAAGQNYGNDNPDIGIHRLLQRLIVTRSAVAASHTKRASVMPLRPSQRIRAVCSRAFAATWFAVRFNETLEGKPRLRRVFQNRTQRQHCSATMSAVADKQLRLRSGEKVRFE